MRLDLAVASFDRTEGAEKAYADVRERASDAPWMHEIAFVEHHKRGRIVVRGVFAGHFLDIEDEADPIGKDVGVGALTGAVVGAAFGPPGFAAGLVGGGIVGGLIEGSHVEELHGGFFDEVRADVPEGASALVLLAAPDHVDAMDGRGPGGHRRPGRPSHALRRGGGAARSERRDRPARGLAAPGR